MLMQKRMIPVALAAACLVLSASLWLRAADEKMADDNTMSADQTLKLKGMLADKGKMDSIRDDIAKDDAETHEIREAIRRQNVERLLMRDAEVSSKVRAMANDPDVIKRKTDHAKPAPLDDAQQMRKIVKEMVLRESMHEAADGDRETMKEREVIKERD